MRDIESTCPTCRGGRYRDDVLSVQLDGLSISDVLALTVAEAYERLASDRSIARKLQVMIDLGLGYLVLGQFATTLSGGEAQRLKLATELSKVKHGDHTLYMLDEPTT